MEFDQLINHMSEDCKDLFEKAVATASSRSHFSVDLEHWLWQMLDEQDAELIPVLQHFNISQEHLLADIQSALEALKTGNEGFPKIAPDIARLLFEAWMIASSQYSLLEIRSIHVLLALVENDVLRLRIQKISPSLGALHGEEIRTQCEALLERKAQVTSNTESGSLTKTPALDQFTIDLTAEAKAGKIDPVLGRDNEIRQMIDILCRRRQNNPILTGEAGVGKTAVVEGLALRIVTGDVPDNLQNVSLRSLDMGLLQAGAGVKGEFENRLKNVIKEVQNSPRPVILFIDEAHTLIGAGNQAGAGDAANLLKPALARGELRTIAATTWAEYKKYIEKDAALTRRFQVVKIEEPDAEQAIIMLRSMVEMLENHHSVVILDEAVESAVKLSQRYIAGRQLPDKCVSLLDTACARVNLGLCTTPASIENREHMLDNLATEITRIKREQASGYEHEEDITELEVKKVFVEAERHSLEGSWKEAKELIKQISTLRREIELAHSDESDVKHDTSSPAKDIKTYQAELKKKRTQLVALRKQLADLQTDTTMIYECVDTSVIAEVVADWTGIPVGRMQSDEINSVLRLQDHLEERVIGQTHALEMIARHMQTAHAKLTDPRRPLGVFMLAGPSGVGKTETALALAERLYGSERNITIINMSEFKEEHKVSLLMGSPPGYVGYGEGGLLTEAVRRKPYSVVLLDEIEKAHPGVQDIFYQVFDKGMLRDGEGRDIDFKNTVIIMTSNTASEQIEKLCIDPDTRPTPEAMVEAIAPSLREVYKPAFLGRINVIPYYALDEVALGNIARIQLDAIKQRVHDNYQTHLTYTDSLIEHITSQCQQSDTGARQINAVLTNTLLPDLSEAILKHLASNKPLVSVEVGIKKNSVFDIKIKQAKQRNKSKKVTQVTLKKQRKNVK
ncbi:MAG TPA: type VI secretion system ATPase TssH [Gammaproteobacteria bacterium]|nr:type VI secretion system ATPase TssH [Gammaproteobacteria bacterium]